MSAAVALMFMCASPAMLAQAPRYNNGGMPGLVVAGSENYQQLPEKARKFVEKHFKDSNVAKCEKYFAKGKYEVELTNGIDIEFDAQGTVTEIDAPDRAYIASSIVKDILPHKAFSRLEKEGLSQTVESVEFKKGKVYEVDVNIPGPDTYVFDINGEFLMIED